MHEFGGVDELIGLREHLAADALKTARAGLEVGDADDVVIGHGDGDVFCGRPRQGGIAAALQRAGSPRPDRDIHGRKRTSWKSATLRMPAAIMPCRGAGNVARALGDQGIEVGVADRRERRIKLAGGSRLRRRRRRGRRRIRHGAVKARREGAQARLDADAGGADGCFIRLARERQRAAAGKRAEQHGRDGAAGALGERRPCRRR